MSEELKKCIKELERLCGDVELVSYGLAPNPNGFCYEKYSDVNTNKLDELLGSLSSEDEETIKALYL